ncbi:proline-rich protein 3-like [Lactuca sativa]|uniref:proline-rich protein 3-like n=1 Tax=Lactuca sativa TaxID=4236 RepID=UPI000CD90280|nr:proline-rich protein 3-like [Lactuca sativa]
MNAREGCSFTTVTKENEENSKETHSLFLKRIRRGGFAPSPPPVTSIPPIYTTITSQPFSTIPLPPPIFSEATTTTTIGVQTNVFDTGVRSLAPETTTTTKPTEIPIFSKPPSPTPTTETNTVLGGDDVDMDTFYYSPYRVQSDDAPMTKKHLKELNENIDNLIVSSSSQDLYTEAAIQGMVDTFVKANEASISKATAAIEASTKGEAELNANKVNAIVKKFIMSLETEKQHFATMRQQIQSDNNALQNSINEHLSKV